jgi:hypothetical protein
MGAVRSRLEPSGQVPQDERMRSRARSTLVLASSHDRRSSWSLARSQRWPVARSIEPRAWQADLQSLSDASSSPSARDRSARETRRAASTPRGSAASRSCGGGGGGGCWGAGLGATLDCGGDEGCAKDAGASAAPFAPAAADGGASVLALGAAAGGALPPHAAQSTKPTMALRVMKLALREA